MQKLLFAAGTSFLRVFGITFLMAATGILAAPNLSAAVGLSVAALVASIAAGLRAIQVFIPQLTFSNYLPVPIGSWVDAFVRAFIAALIVGIVGLLEMPELPTGRSVWLAVIIGALTAGVRAIQGLLSPGESPAPEKGLSIPQEPSPRTP